MEQQCLYHLLPRRVNEIHSPQISLFSFANALTSPFPLMPPSTLASNQPFGQQHILENLLYQILLTSFDLAIHIKYSDIHSAEDCEGHKVKVFFVPQTKSSPHGEDLYWAQQDGDCDPESAFINYLMVNNLPLDAPLFAYRHSSGYFWPLTWTPFTKCLNNIALQLGLGVLWFCGIWIGSVLEYLLWGLPLGMYHSF